MSGASRGIHMNTGSERTEVRGRGLPLAGDDIDTDRIIPARFLTAVSFEDLGRHAFEDERFDEAGRQKEHPFNDPRYAGAAILIVGRNFGCGSSREHAPQSLMRWGIRAVVGESFAEIFSGNCTAIGLPAVRTSRDTVERLARLVDSDPSTEISVDLENREIRASGERFPCQMPEGDRKMLATGEWDTTGVLLKNLDGVRKTAARVPYMSGFGSEGGQA
jgi:3-isopropylmalate/(R)-2-methylmalate dehydratase small subunit